MAVKLFRNIIIIFFLLLLIGCKTKEIIEKDLSGNIFFRKLIKESESIEKMYISGLFKVSGLNNIPQVYLKFESSSNIKDKLGTFKILSFNTPLIDIILDKDKIIFINHANKEYVKLNKEQIDFSKVIGLNFNPLDLAYFFAGNIPYSANMELMNFNVTNRQYIMEITDRESKYSIIFNAKKEMENVKINSQYFDKINIDMPKYSKDSTGKAMPYMLSISSESTASKLSFIINKTLLNKNFEIKLFDQNILRTYKVLDSMDKIKINIKQP